MTGIMDVRGVTLWREGFESKAAELNWAPTRGNWLIGPPANTKGPARAHSGARCAAVGLRTNYLNNVSSSLVYTQPLQIPDKSRNPMLRFWHWFAIDFGNDCSQGPDYGQVKVLLPDRTEEVISPT